MVAKVVKNAILMLNKIASPPFIKMISLNFHKESSIQIILMNMKVSLKSQNNQKSI